MGREAQLASFCFPHIIIKSGIKGLTSRTVSLVSKRYMRGVAEMKFSGS